ncbi:hypothetical protein D3C79_740150 [compost metagenome]
MQRAACKVGHVDLAIGEPARLAVAQQVGHGQVETCLGGEPGLGLVALPAGLALLQLDRYRQTAEQHAQQTDDPEHQQQGRTALAAHGRPPSPDRSSSRLTCSSGQA